MTTQTDHTEITLLVDRFFRALDDREFQGNRAERFLTEDARMETPLGTFEGADALRGTEEALGRYERTQHIASGVLVETAEGGDEATATWNALMTHVHGDATRQMYGADADPLFTVGGRFDAGLVRTTDGWRFRRVAVHPIWTQGRPPVGVGDA
ncbi:nuclear transport factor 2 family protein [Streptomyces triticisoli]|uniref:nuclear transport factor 2 family protein n=1 Tax=Streptomyces triticisoli TaxID=2182797 RepID=UPI000DD89878|nr:nuclear transport factor 2 family protein [Streptomyces triticisoli]